MKMEYTPGPWECRSGAVIKPDHTYDGIPLADMDREPGNGTTPVERDANAWLMAAAPDLLAALDTLTDHAQEVYPHFESERGQKDIAQALAALAKARGEA